MKRIYSNQSGFTLLEIILAIVIIGILASVAIPRLFATVEYTRSIEAWNNLISIRGSVERCKLFRVEEFAEFNNNCGLNDPNTGLDNLDIEDPSDSPGAHFQYHTESLGSGFGYLFRIVATRNGLNNGETIGDQVYLEFVRIGSEVRKCGSGVFAPIGTCLPVNPPITPGGPSPPPN